MDHASIRERVKNLQAEMAILQKEARLYDRSRRHNLIFVRAHEARIMRMEQIPVELAELQNATRRDRR